MARGRRKKPFQPGRVDPEEVLSGRIALSAGELMALIRWVNPSERGLDAVEQAQRYQVKSRLQSLLIRSRAELLDFVADPAADQLVLLRTRDHLRSACHAPLDELDEDARAIVRRRLDEEASAPEDDDTGEQIASASSPAPRRVDWAADPNELVVRGTAALGEYDFERARELYEHALELEPASLTAARALLGLMVDQLASYDEALALADRLDPSCVADPAVRERVALAAAALGRTSEAAALIRDLEGESVVEVWVAIARQVLDAGELDDAAQALSAARAAGAVTPDVLVLEEQLAKARSRARQPDEEMIEQAMAAGRTEEARERAHRLLASDPHSRVARRALAKLDADERAQRAAAYRAAGDRAMDERDFDAAVTAYERALAEGAEPDSIAAALEHARSIVTQRRNERELAAVAELLSSDVDAALQAYLQLQPAVREQLRKRCDAPILAWLDAIGSSSRARPADLCAAARALAAAHDAMERQDPEAVAALLEPHARVLSAVPAARKLGKRARVAVREQRATRATRTLAAAIETLQAGELERARHLLSELDRGGLSPADRERAVSCDTRLAHLTRCAQLAAEEREHEARDDLLAACAAAAALAAFADDELVRAGATERARQLREQLRETWQLTLWGADPDDRLTNVDLSALGQSPKPCLSPGGDRLALANAHDALVRIRIVGVADGRVHQCVTLRSPVPLGWVSARWQGGAIWVVGDRGLVRLSPSTWDLTGWWPVAAYTDAEEIVDRVLLTPDGRYAWMFIDDQGQRGRELDRIRVVDLETQLLCRRLAYDFYAAQAITGRTPPRMLAIAGWGQGQLYEPRGARDDRERLPDLPVSLAAVHPSGTGMVLAHTEVDGEDDGPLLVSPVSPTGELGAVAVDEDRDYAYEMTHSLATSTAERMSYLLALSAHHEGNDLVGLQPTGDHELDVAWTAKVSPRSAFAIDERSRNVVALDEAPAGLRIARLNTEPPPWPPHAGGSLEFTELPSSLMSWFICGAFKRSALELALQSSLASVAEPELDDHIARFEREHADEPEELLALFNALQTALRGHAQSRMYIERIWERYPSHAGVALAHAKELARQYRWPAVQSVLEAIELDEPPPAHSQHLLHLLGMAVLINGDDARAHALWTRAATLEGNCPMAALCTYVAPLPEPLSLGDWIDVEPRARQLRVLTAIADQRFDAGDPTGALTALDRPVVWRTNDQQTLARVARAWLAVDDVTGIAQVRKAVGLGAFLTAMLRNWTSLPIPSATWSVSTLDNLAQRSRDWLTATFGLTFPKDDETAAAGS